MLWWRSGPERWADTLMRTTDYTELTVLYTYRNSFAYYYVSVKLKNICVNNFHIQTLFTLLQLFEYIEQ